MRALLLAFAVAACSSALEELPPPQLPQRAGVDPIVAARAEGVEFRAVGHAPDFVLQIYREDHITLAWDSGARQETFPKPAPVLPRWNGEIYETHNDTHRLRVLILYYQPCAAPGAEARQVAVTVVIDGEEREGCGSRI